MLLAALKMILKWKYPPKTRLMSMFVVVSLFHIDTLNTSYVLQAAVITLTACFPGGGRMFLTRSSVEPP